MFDSSWNAFENDEKISYCGIFGDNWVDVQLHKIEIGSHVGRERCQET